MKNIHGTQCKIFSMVRQVSERGDFLILHVMRSRVKMWFTLMKYILVSLDNILSRIPQVKFLAAKNIYIYKSVNYNEFIALH